MGAIDIGDGNNPEQNDPTEGNRSSTLSDVILVCIESSRNTLVTTK